MKRRRSVRCRPARLRTGQLRWITSLSSDSCHAALRARIFALWLTHSFSSAAACALSPDAPPGTRSNWSGPTSSDHWPTWSSRTSIS
jgi:hypothetical protein